ncbi:hypothetical protein L596_025181 [Steinernema carpocapsae]|uniref:Uncharacterized protein n=1 Tax=Steinernema carpocapsae TaxID=34508 RepID=A0A4U5M717_STECR|nr:hypothetical protein L596_025181 [Steinernema carpocapsae]
MKRDGPVYMIFEFFEVRQIRTEDEIVGHEAIKRRWRSRCADLLPTARGLGGWSAIGLSFAVICSVCGAIEWCRFVYMW